MREKIRKEIFDLSEGIRMGEATIEEFTDDANFTNDLGFDSLDKIEHLMKIEKHYEIAIPDDHAENFDCVGDIITYLEIVLNSA